MVSTEGIGTRGSPGRVGGCIPALIAFGGILLLMFFAVLYSMTREDKRRHEADLRACQEDLKKQIEEVRSGQRKSLYFYCSVGMDGLLEQLIDVPGIEAVRLDLTDVTDEGMESLAAIKTLKSLIVYGGSTSVGDVGFSSIKTISSLERLELINTRVTDRSLPGLKELPNLRSLTLYRDAKRGPALTDAGLTHLKALTELRQLNLSGGWASDAAVKELQTALPNCKISTKEGDLDI